VTGTLEGEIDISWSASPEPDIDRYRLERSLAPDFEPGSEPFEEPAVSFTDSGLYPGWLYYYRVYAIDTGGNVSPPSSVDSALAQNLPPAAPTGLVATTGSAEGEIDLDWDSNEELDFDHYRVERDEDPGFGSPTSFTSAGSFATDSGLSPSGTYYYRVYAVDETPYESGPSNTDSAVALDLPPEAPTGLVAVPGAGEGAIDVDWEDNTEPDLDDYVLERDTDPGFGSPTSIPVDVSYYSDLGLTPGTTYYYRVMARDVYLNVSGPSSTASAAATDLAPAVPTGLTAVPGAGEGEIDVSWDANTESDFDHYRLERHTDPGFGPGSDPFDTPAAFFPDSGLVPGETYYYRVIAVDVGGNESAPSAVDSAVATDLPPAAPTGLVALTGSAEGEIEITWDASSDPDFDRYRLERSTAPDFEPGSEPFEGAVASFTDTGLPPGQLYYYRVYAIDTGENVSDPSNVDSAAALDLTPAAPTGLTAVEGVAEGDVDVSWDANTELDIDFYRLERDTTAAFGPGTVSQDVPGTAYTDPALDPGTYFYRLFAVDLSANVSAPSDTVSITLEQTGVDEELVAGVSFVRPNPFSTETTIHYTVPSEGADVSIALYDIRGRLVRTLVERSLGGGVYEAAWNGRDENGRAVSLGVYFARVSVGKWGETRKIAYVR
jgi:fibronectin type 3 domain-containing protein